MIPGAATARSGRSLRRAAHEVGAEFDEHLRAPLAPGGLETPLMGRQAVHDWLAQLYPVLGETNVLEHYYNEELTVIASRADVHITEPPSTLRVVDRFTINAEGEITAQENHVDPRPALRST